MKRILVIGTFVTVVMPSAVATAQTEHARSLNHSALSSYVPSRRETLAQMPASLAAAVRRAIPPSWGPYFSTSEFFPSDGTNNEQFGYAEALSANGDVALVGASEQAINGTLSGNHVIISRGAAYVFIRHGASYIQTAELTEPATVQSPNPIQSVGRAVALSSDGQIALVGALGSAFVFAAGGGKYRQIAKFKGTGNSVDSFGSSVALNGAGNIALVGEWNQSVGSNQGQGVAYLYKQHDKQHGPGYALLTMLTAKDGNANDNFGSSVALSADGTTAVIGSPSRAVSANVAAGVVYVFRQAGTRYKPASELTAKDPASGDQLGYAVAVSQNGSVVLGGAPGVLASGSLTAGKGYLFDRQGTGYTQAAELTPSGSGGSAGYSVAVNGAGTVAVLGAPNRSASDGNPNTGEVSVGAAYVFQGSGATYTLVGQPTAFDGSMHDNFGSSVAVDADGSVILGGADGTQVTIPALPPGQDKPTSGAVYTFGLSGKSVPSGESASEMFGWAVAISATGHTAVVGAIGQTVGGNANAGAAYVFIRPRTSYVQLAELNAAHPAMNDSFGQALAISANGRMILVGAPGNNNQTGAAFVFMRQGKSFTQTQELTASNGGLGYHFGYSVALSASGTVALIGARDFGPDGTGKGYVFDLSSGRFRQMAQLIGKDTGTSSDQFGASVALSADGTIALAGAPLHKVGDVNMAGAAYLFTGGGRTYKQTAELTANDGKFNDGFGKSVALSAGGSTAVVGAPSHSVNGTPNQGAMYVFRSTKTGYRQRVELTASDGAMGDALGTSAAMSANGQTILAGAPFHNGQSGAAYLFSQTGGSFSQTGELTQAQPVAHQSLGFSVALTADSATALAAGTGDSLNHVSGAAFTFAVGGALPSTFQLSSKDLSRKSSHANTSVSGDTVRFRAAVVTDYGVAAGTVDFVDGTKTIRGCGAVALVGSRGADCVTSALSVSHAGHVISATYTPNVNTAAMYECGACVASITEVVTPKKKALLYGSTLRHGV
ncbi:MAG TPA: hypothetical protein VG815_04935 [Chloroflexota bacterium]|jgi:hypothetical protein|nr:hypothetical protein [Chloroflexota bacterium]